MIWLIATIAVCVGAAVWLKQREEYLEGEVKAGRLRIALGEDLGG